MPDVDPSEEDVPWEIRSGVEESLQRHPSYLVRCLLWTIAMQSAFEQSGLRFAIPGFRLATYGLAVIEGRPTLAAIAYGDWTWWGQIGQAFTLELKGAIFPVIVRRPFRSRRDHRPPMDAAYLGTAACWATVRHLPNAETTGFLTAAHVATKASLNGPPLHLGDRIRVGQAFGSDETAGFGQLLALGNDHVDAAVIAPGSAIQVGPQLLVRDKVAAGEEVWLLGAVSQRPTLVTEVAIPRATISDRIENLIFLQQPGRAGDSGAMVQAVTDGAGVGLYLGDFPTVFGQVEGRCQLLAQVQRVLDLDLYE